ncbi:L-ascorbate metabolism protein UlaG, beta-lactamase superfamily [Lutibacter oricola]|uniref:L-ascorbate metabolism protein UlaG, beta-lactamase superfamily n=1 Tax=Lutibacter oricola TaxID=762486 RepID=A0A1H3C853_9FLAO|nr:MBL fold metallo-hydrolase [Lutibacter oricola]SDX50313.1 L-ascorbate metabolism protein UlaG, beta-lactamase superfamily [Lutibacter oricola]
MKYIFTQFALLFIATQISFAQTANKDVLKTANGQIEIKPITHSSFVLTYNNKTIYVDPHGGFDFYKNETKPDVILITDIHPDHLDLKTIEAIDTSNAIFIVPLEVSMQLPEKYLSKTTILNNGQGVHRLDMFVQAIPMYNLPEEATSKHPKGRGNGYVLNIDDKRIYISGDTEDIVEMRTLVDIDVAFVCMNLPYTMDINQAAEAVLEFQPKIVYPYHYRGKGNFSDVNKFKELVNTENQNIEVRIRKWYPNN